MGNFYAPSPRLLNQRGQNVYDRLNIIMGVIFVITMIIYAGVRGHRVVTQLPATYRTTKTPKQLFSNEYVDAIFPSQVPSATYEFPAIIMCPQDPAASLVLGSCAKVSIATEEPCRADGVYVSNVTVTGGETLTCLVLNDPPGGAAGDTTTALVANSAQDVLDVAVSVVGTRAGRPVGIFVQLHDQSGKGSSYEADFEDFSIASAFGRTEIMARKIYHIDMDANFTTDFETKTSFSLYNSTMDLQAATAPVGIEIKYPKLECVYEKEFLPLDMNNWLGEVGGVAALLMFLYRSLSFLLAATLLHSNKHSEPKNARTNYTEGFAYY
ncbi:hypothetical protein DFJ73DRAFT_956756 [Zopfochytrium polystomum]|nr:hypothetical protein DFJ73DRAFT_956756 [Zopfochytrium polystomum]